MSSAEEQRYIWRKLIPELESRMEGWAAEYKQPRELGAAAEFVGLHRKVGKLKTIIWDGVDPADWREDPETIIFEVIAHGLLMLYDVRHQRPRMVDSDLDQQAERMAELERWESEQALVRPKSTRTHEFRGQTHHNHPGYTCEEWWAMTEDDQRG